MAVADGPPPGPAGRGSTLDRLDAADRRVSRRVAVDWPHPAWFARPLGAFSLTGNYGILWYAVALLPWLTGGRRPLATLALRRRRRHRRRDLGFVVKHFVGRHRPTVADPSLPNHIPLPLSKSMPSSHASMAVTAMLDAGHPVPGVAARRSIAATAVLAFSRVYLGVHYLGDVVAGLVFGLVFGGLYVWLVPAPF